MSGSTTSKNSRTSRGINSSKLQTLQINRVCDGECLATKNQAFQDMGQPICYKWRSKILFFEGRKKVQ